MIRLYVLVYYDLYIQFSIVRENLWVYVVDVSLFTSDYNLYMIA